MVSDPSPRHFLLFWREFVLSQLSTSSFWISVALMMVPSEIDISMSVRVFEDMTFASLRQETDLFTPRCIRSEILGPVILLRLEISLDYFTL